MKLFVTWVPMIYHCSENQYMRHTLRGPPRSVGAFQWEWQGDSEDAEFCEIHW